jgi:hypothetical protein
MLSKLPATQAILAAYHAEAVVDVSGRQHLDLAPVLRLNESFDMFHIPALLLFRYGMFAQKFQVVSEKPKGGIGICARGI